MIPVKLYFISKSHMATTNIDYNTIPRAAKSQGVQAQFRQLVNIISKIVLDVASGPGGASAVLYIGYIIL